MLRRMISRFGIVRICSRLQQGDAERGIIVEAGGSVQAGKGIVGQIIGSEEAIGIGAMAQEDSCSFSQISSLTCLAVVAGEADVKERLTVLWPALRLRHGWHLCQRKLYPLPVSKHKGHIKACIRDFGIRGQDGFRALPVGYSC